MYASAQDVSHAAFDNYALRYNADEIAKTKYLGSPFLYEDWRRAEVIIKGDTVQYRQAKYNIEKNIMEVNVRGEHLYIRGGLISQFRWRGYEGEGGSTYQPNVSLVKADADVRELLRTTVFDNFRLITSQWVVVRSPSSETPQLGGSVNEGRIVKQRRHFIMKDNELHPVKKLKDLFQHFEVDAKQIKKIVKSEKLDLDRHQDLVSLFKQIAA